MDEQQALKTYFTTVPRTTKYICWLMKWDETKTIRENKENLGIPNMPSANNFCRTFKLGSREGYHRVIKTDKEAMLILKKNGLNMSDIARLLGVSSERIRQIMNKK